MKKKQIEEMLEGIDDKYLEESLNMKSYSKQRSRMSFEKIAVAVVLVLVLAGTGVSVLAATNNTFRKYMKFFTIHGRDENIGKGVIVKKKKMDKNVSNKEKKQSNKTYYLTLSYIPKGYACAKGETYCYYGADKDTDYFQIAFFHLKSDFTNVLPKAEKMENITTDFGVARIAVGKYENRAWVLFENEGYMVEIRDRNRSLPLKEMKKMVTGAKLVEDKPEIVYEAIDWTKELQQSYEESLKRYSD